MNEQPPKMNEQPPKIHDRPLKAPHNNGMSSQKANFNCIKDRIATLFQRLEIESEPPKRMQILRELEQIRAGLGRQRVEGKLGAGHVVYLMEMIELKGHEPKINPKHYERPKETWQLDD